MKKVLVVLAVMMFSVAGFANHGPAGCGLGSILFEGKDGLVMNVLAATFNGTSGNQTFGMSTGTLGCEDAKTAMVSAVSFVEANQVALANDIAKGQGTTLNVYLEMIGQESDSASKLQANFGAIFAAKTPAEIHQNILAIL
jgi:hypothetical protein